MAEPDDRDIKLEDLPRDQLHELVDQICDARDKAAAANDPATALKAESEASAAADRFICGAVGKIKSRRLGAALGAYNVFDIEAATVEAEALGQHDFGPHLLRDRKGIIAVRRMLSRALLDVPWLPRWLALAVVDELFWANFGGNMKWLAKPTRPPGMPENHAAQTYLDAVLLTRVHYHKGYHGVSLAEAAVAVLQDAEGARWDTLQRTGRRLKMNALCDDHERQGKQDKAARRPFNPPMGADYDAVELEAARREMRTNRTRTKIV